MSKGVPEGSGDCHDVNVDINNISIDIVLKRPSGGISTATLTVDHFGLVGFLC